MAFSVNTGQLFYHQRHTYFLWGIWNVKNNYYLTYNIILTLCTAWNELVIYESSSFASLLKRKWNYLFAVKQCHLVVENCAEHSWTLYFNVLLSSCIYRTVMSQSHKWLPFVIHFSYVPNELITGSLLWEIFWWFRCREFWSIIYFYRSEIILLYSCS